MDERNGIGPQAGYIGRLDGDSELLCTKKYEIFELGINSIGVIHAMQGHSTTGQGKSTQTC